MIYFLYRLQVCISVVNIVLNTVSLLLLVVEVVQSKIALFKPVRKVKETSLVFNRKQNFEILLTLTKIDMI